MGFNLNFSYGKAPNYVERDNSGNFFYSFLDKLFGVEKQIKDTTKYTFQNPSLLILRKFIADYGSLAKIHAYQNNNLTEEDFLYQLAERPNPNQTWTEFIWQYFFNASCENVYLYAQNGTMYFLKKENIELTSEQQKGYQKLYFSNATRRSALKGNFKYCNTNGLKDVLKLENLYIIDCFSGADGDWFNGSNMITSLKGIINNSTEAIESKGRNIFFSKKFLLTGNQTEAQRIATGTMHEKEHQSITQSLLSEKPIHSVKDNLSVNQLVNNLKNLGLDESFNADFAKLARAFNIPSDLIDLIQKNSVFNEGKEKSLGLFVYYNLVPMLQKLTDILEVIFEVEDLRPSYSHCQFNKVFEKEKQQDIKLQLENLKVAQELGMDVSKQLKEIYNGY